MAGRVTHALAGSYLIVPVWFLCEWILVGNAVVWVTDVVGLIGHSHH